MLAKFSKTLAPDIWAETSARRMAPAKAPYLLTHQSQDNHTGSYGCQEHAYMQVVHLSRAKDMRLLVSATSP